MKKIRFFISFVLVFALFTTTSLAQVISLFYDGSDYDAAGKTYTVKINGEIVETDVPAFLIYDKYPMIPLRAVFEALGATIEWDGSSRSTVVKADGWTIGLKQDEREVQVNGKDYSLEIPVKAVSSGGYGRTMVPLSLLSEYLNISTEVSNTTKVISINYAKPKSTPAPENSPKPGNVAQPKVTPKPSAKPVSTDTPKPSAAPEPEKTPEASMKPGTETPQSPAPASPTPAPTVAPSASPAPSGTPTVSPNPENVITDVLYYNENGSERIEITFKNRKGYNIMRLSNPNRLVVDFNDAVAGVEGSRTNGIKGSIVKKYGLMQYDSKTARAVIEVEGLPDYDVETSWNKIVLKFRASKLKNISYTNDKDRVCLILKGARLTEGDANLKKLYQEELNSNGTTYIIGFPSKLADLNTGRLIINDKYIERIEVSNITSKAMTTITFYTKEKIHFNIITRPETNDTAITLLKPYSSSDRLVVIDPGHGGVDPGAVSGNVQEKNLNLDIALRLNKLLKEKGVKTYMIREDDSFVGLYERPYIANALNASLFISIHNNASAAPSASGTETLYTQENPYDKSLFGKRFAQIIQDNLIARLKSVNRKIVHRPGLVVLKATKMPAALAEVGFLTNSNELSNLLRESYRQSAAEALCDAVIKALGELK